MTVYVGVIIWLTHADQDSFCSEGKRSGKIYMVFLLTIEFRFEVGDDTGTNLFGLSTQYYRRAHSDG